ncbi:MAG: hypothetical protein RBU37_15745 [Myxococcota bacterium]|jgi:hypothetical protein|nr:hypothetical protein [Myxococcota bacterium]
MMTDLNENKWGKQAKRPMDKNLGEQAKRPIYKNLGEQAKRPIDKQLSSAPGESDASLSLLDLLERAELPGSGQLRLSDGLELDWNSQRIVARRQGRELFRAGSHETLSVQLSRYEAERWWHRFFPRAAREGYVLVELRSLEQRLALCSRAPTPELLGGVAAKLPGKAAEIPWLRLVDLLETAVFLGAEVARFDERVAEIQGELGASEPSKVESRQARPFRYPHPLTTAILGLVLLAVATLFGARVAYAWGGLTAFILQILLWPVLSLTLVHVVLRMRGRASGLLSLAIGLGVLPLGLPVAFDNVWPALCYAVSGPPPVQALDRLEPAASYWRFADVRVDTRSRRADSEQSCTDDGSCTTTYVSIAPIRQAADESDEVVHAWAVCSAYSSSTRKRCELNWEAPPRGGIRADVEEYELLRRLRDTTGLRSAPDAPFVELTASLDSELGARSRRLLYIYLGAAVVLLFFAWRWRQLMLREHRDRPRS